MTPDRLRPSCEASGRPSTTELRANRLDHSGSRPFIYAPHSGWSAKYVEIQDEFFCDLGNIITPNSSYILPDILTRYLDSVNKTIHSWEDTPEGTEIIIIIIIKVFI